MGRPPGLAPHPTSAGLLLLMLLSRVAAAVPAPEDRPAPEDGPAAPVDIPAPGLPASNHAPPPPVAPQGAETRLENAIRDYQAGRHDLALTLLTALVRDEPDEAAVVRDARVYMAEIFLVQGNESAAREALEQVLQASPDLELDPFEHPPDICAFFELVKASGTWRPAPVPSTLAPPRAPTRPSSLLPLGIAQFRQGRPVPGTLLAIGQGAACGLSAGLFTWLAVDRKHGSKDEAGFAEDGSRLWTLDTLQARRAVQWSATGLCYGAYGLGVLDASIAGRRARSAEQPTVHQASPPLPPLTVQVRGRF